MPDVTVFDKSHPIEQILTHSPIAVFEVISPEDRMPRMMVKLMDYERMGIQSIFLVDPSTGTISRLIQCELQVAPPTQELAGSACFIDWKRVREFLD